MATDFWVTIAHADRVYARQAATEALSELERLENLLSRYVEQSDVSRIHELPAGASLVLHPDTYDCIQLSLEMEADTHGAFNIAYLQQPARGATQLLTLSPRPPCVQVTAAHVALDLGGIGKGFALDRMAALLVDWDVPQFLLRASASTMLAGEAPPGSDGWPVRFGPPEHVHTLHLRQAAFSGSGIAVKGSHIFDPQTGQPARNHRMAWAGTITAAHADALSTALMVMNEPASRTYCQQHPATIAYVMGAGDASLQRLGREHGEVFR